MTLIKIETDTQFENLGGYDPDDRWTRDSFSGVTTIQSAKIVDRDEFNTIPSKDDFVIGDKAHIVYAQYTTGDSFGSDGGNYELLGAFKSKDDANKCEQHYRSLSSDDYSVPWNGYFESLDSIDIVSIELT
jgi:hypothetical protein